MDELKGKIYCFL